MTAGPRDLLTTDELVVAGGVTRELLYRWVAERLIARPTFTDSPNGGLIAVWSPDSLERVRFIHKKQREGLTPKELADLVRERSFPIMKHNIPVPATTASDAEDAEAE